MPFTYLGGTNTAFLAATQPTQVQGKTAHQQQSDTSCWLNCAKHISNFHSSRRAAPSLYREDVQLGDINKMGPAVDLLMNMGHKTERDKYRTPHFEDLREAIDEHKPLLIQVGPTNTEHVALRANTKAMGGHFMVIVGYQAKQDANNVEMIAIFDPSDGNIHECEFNRTHVRFGTYEQEGWVYNHSSYVDDFTGAASTQGSGAGSSSSSSATSSSSSASAAASTSSNSTSSSSAPKP